MLSLLTNTKHSKNKMVKNVQLLTTTPFWFQKRMFKNNIKEFKISHFKNLLNKEIIIKAQELKIKNLENFKEENRLRVMDSKRITNEKLYMLNFKKFITNISSISIKYGTHINIFGGILAKIINPEFKLDNYDIDMFFSSSINLTLDKFILIISILEKEKIIFNSNLIVDNTNNASRYSMIRSRPGMINIHLVKAKTYFKGIGFIDLDILSGSPKPTEIDCSISNLYYNINLNMIRLIKEHESSLIETLFDLRHKTGKLLIENKECGLDNLSRYILISSRQKKYNIQGWDISNKLLEVKVQDDWLCPVCYEKLKPNNCAIKFKCSEKHLFCKTCLVSMINSTGNLNKNKCPLCRAKIEIDFNLNENKQLKALNETVNKTFEFHNKIKSIKITGKSN